MAEISWEKPKATLATRSPFLILSGTANGGRYFITVNDVLARNDLVEKNVKITGAVIGDSIRFDADTKTIHFTIAHVPDDMGEIEKEGGLAAALHAAVINRDARRIQVEVKNQAMPDLLQNEAQAILTGKLGSDGIFHADELNLKCPSKYESDVPQQAQG
jgi:cytochrome c-type biogenesis protein CcmE